MEREIYRLHAEVCQTLANRKRLEILDLLRDGEKRVSELAELTEMNQANVSQHLAVLRARGIVTARRDGANIYYRVANPKIIRACDLLREVLIAQVATHAELVGASLPSRSRR